MSDSEPRSQLCREHAPGFTCQREVEGADFADGLFLPRKLSLREFWQSFTYSDHAVVPLSEVIFVGCSCSKPQVSCYSTSETYSARKLVIPVPFSLQNDSINQQLASIFTHCYGSSPIPSIPEIRKTLPARLGKVLTPTGKVL